MLRRHQFRGYLILKSVSKPFDAGKWVELMFKAEAGDAEILKRIPAEDADEFQIGKVWTLGMLEL